MNKTHVIICSEDTVYFWQFRSQYSSQVSIESEKKKKAGKENAFFIDEIPNHKSMYDIQRWKPRNQLIDDPICSVSAGNDGFIVGRESGTVLKFTLPYIQLAAKLTLRCKPQTIVMNNECTKFAVIDINGVLTFFDTEAYPRDLKFLDIIFLKKRKKCGCDLVWR
ncbi:MAG: hypothetical protein IPK55_13730 [Streptococcus sp.]|nr:hypothetical protein [Streptococcus sp.]